MNWKVICICVVCLALPLFVGLLGPSLCVTRVSSGPHPTLFVVNIIDKAIEMYYRQHRQYPGKDLVQCLTGYRDDDGQPGYGYRLHPGGKAYGPWNGAHRLPTNGDPPHFVDSFGNEIEHHLFEEMSDYMKASGAGESAVYYRKDYVVRSRGPNGKWDNPRDHGSDDLTNMSQ